MKNILICRQAQLIVLSNWGIKANLCWVRHLKHYFLHNLVRFVGERFWGNCIIFKQIKIDRNDFGHMQTQICEGLYFDSNWLKWQAQCSHTKIVQMLHQMFQACINKYNMYILRNIRHCVRTCITVISMYDVEICIQVKR